MVSLWMAELGTKNLWTYALIGIHSDHKSTFPENGTWLLLVTWVVQQYFIDAMIAMIVLHLVLTENVCSQTFIPRNSSKINEIIEP